MNNQVKIFASVIDDTTKRQIEELASSNAYFDCEIRVMPDCHTGSGCTIGSVIKFRNRIVPNTVGVDIDCGMLVAELGKVDIDLKELDKVVTEQIPSGFNIHETPKTDFILLDDLRCEGIDLDYMLRSIGTLGGGNHFIELDEDDKGNKYLVIHSGSRNLGVKVCSYYQEKAYKHLSDDSSLRREIIDKLKAEGRQHEIGEALKKIHKPHIKKELAYLEGKDMEDYLHDMDICGRYAHVNRTTMMEIICNALGLAFKDYFTTIHNYVDTTTNIIRKGAISAEKGEKVIIPMNMRDGSLICVGKGNREWLQSAPHGAGRIMSRMQAFKQIDIEDFQKSMQGIYTTSVCEGTKDEAPMVYKPMEVILKDIEPTVEIKKIIKPLWNFKAKTPEKK